MEVCVDYQELLAGFFVPEETYQSLIIPFKVTMQIVFGAHVVEINWLLGKHLEFILFVTDQHCIHVTTIMQLAIVAVLFELRLIDFVVIVDLLEAYDVGQAVPVVEYFLDYSI